LLRTGVIFAGGESWHEIRNFTIRGLRSFGIGKKAAMEILISEEAEVVVKDIQESLEGNNGIWTVDIYRLSASVVNVIWGIIAGNKLDLDDPIVQNILELDEEIAHILSQHNIYNTFPVLKRWFPKLVKHDVHLKTHAEHHAFMRVGFKS